MRMMNKGNILQFIQHVHKKGRGIPDRRPMHPHREWLTGLLLFAIVTALGTGVGIWSFETYKNIDKKTYTVDVTIPEYNEKLAQTVLTYYGQRKQNYQTAVGQIEPIVIVATTTASTSGAFTTATGTVEGWYASLLPPEFLDGEE